MKTIVKEYKIYEFKELSEEAKEKALEHFSDINVDYEWWDFIYADAEEVGIKITEFDLYPSAIKGHLTEDGKSVAEKIIKNHGEDCGTYKVAKKFLLENLTQVEVLEKLGVDVDEKREEIERDFEYDILREYLSILRRDYEYLTSKEAVIETIECNEYEFLENGTVFHG